MAGAPQRWSKTSAGVPHPPPGTRPRLRVRARWQGWTGSQHTRALGHLRRTLHPGPSRSRPKNTRGGKATLPWLHNALACCICASDRHIACIAEAARRNRQAQLVAGPCGARSPDTDTASEYSGRAPANTPTATAVSSSTPRGPGHGCVCEMLFMPKSLGIGATRVANAARGAVWPRAVAAGLLT